jgi:hypothetical protein
VWRGGHWTTSNNAQRSRCRDFAGWRLHYLGLIRRDCTSMGDGHRTSRSGASGHNKEGPTCIDARMLSSSRLGPKAYISPEQSNSKLEHPGLTTSDTYTYIVLFIAYAQKICLYSNCRGFTQIHFPYALAHALCSSAPPASWRQRPSPRSTCCTFQNLAEAHRVAVVGR